MSGGGSAGTMDIPDYMEQIQQDMFNVDEDGNYKPTTGRIGPGHNITDILLSSQDSKNPFHKHFDLESFKYPNIERQSGFPWSKLGKDYPDFENYAKSLNTSDVGNKWRDFLAEAVAKAGEEHNVSKTAVLEALNRAEMAGDKTDEAVGMATSIINSMTDKDIDTIIEGVEGKIEDIKPRQDWEQIVKTAITAVTGEEKFGDQIEIGPIVAAAISNSTGQVKDAIQQSLMYIDEELIKDTVEAFSIGLEPERRAAYRSLSAYMSELNITHSSTFLLGAFMLEEDRIRQVGRFQSELRQRLYEQAVSEHGQSYRAQLTGLIQAEMTIRQTEASIVQTSIQVMANLMTSKVEFQTALARIVSEIKIQGMSMGVQGYLRTFSEALSGMLRVKTVDKISKDDFTKTNTALMAEQFYNNAALWKESIGLRAELSRMLYASLVETEEKNLSAKEGYSLSRFEPYQRAANVLASTTGAAGYVPKSHNPIGTSMGGALQGMAKGAMAASAVPGVGPLAGAGIGALLGGGAGAFQ